MKKALQGRAGTRLIVVGGVRERDAADNQRICKLQKRYGDAPL